MSERYVEVRGRRVRLLQAGAGEPVVLLHGYSFNADDWVASGILRALSANHAVYAIDMPYGVKTRSERFQASRPEYAEFLREALDVLGLVGPAIVGPSASGEAALWYAAKGYPARGIAVIGAVGLREELLSALSASRTPLLTIWGENDDITPPSNAELLAGPTHVWR